MVFIAVATLGEGADTRSPGRKLFLGTLGLFLTVFALNMVVAIGLGF